MTTIKMNNKNIIKIGVLIVKRCKNFISYLNIYRENETNKILINKFSKITDKFKELYDKIMINEYMIGNHISNDIFDSIIEKYKYNPLTLNDLVYKLKHITQYQFQKLYFGEYNTDLLNKCIELRYNKEIIDYLLITKKINFNTETMRSAIYSRSLSVVTYLLDNKYKENIKMMN